MAKRTSESCTGALRECKRRRTKSPPLDAPEGEEVETQEDERKEERSQKKVQSTGGVWRNLDLALSFQSKDLPPRSKIGIAFEFVSAEGGNSGSRSVEPLEISNLASFLGAQVQNILTSKISDGWDPCLDARCWVILKFCLEKSYFRISARFLEAVNRVLIHGLSHLDRNGAVLAELTGLYENVLKCLSLLFISHGRAVNNTHMSLWVSCASAAIKLNANVFSHERRDPSHPSVLLRFSCLVLQQFASFLKVYPNPKQMFLVFVDSLLESSLEFMVLLQQHIRSGGCEFERKLSDVLEDILSNALFQNHTIHMSWFLSLRNTYLMQEGHDSQKFKGGYQRKLFDKVKIMITERKTSMIAVGVLFHLFVRNVKKKKEKIYLESKNDYTSHKSLHISKEHGEVVDEVQQTNQPIFEVFMLFMGPLINFHKVGQMNELDLLEIFHRLKSINRIIEILMSEKIYIPVDDITIGANYSFLKEIYDAICCICKKVFQLPLLTLNVAAEGPENIVVLLVMEFIICLGYFLEIEYKVLGEDLVPVWFMILSSFAIYLSMDQTNNCGRILPDILHLGSRIIKLFTDLRQVIGNPNFALFKAVRFFLSGKDGELDNSLFLSCRSISPQMRLKAVATLLLSQELRNATFNALKSIPEGQASTYIKQLSLDILESLKWLKIAPSCMDGHGSHEGGVLNNVVLDFNLKAEILGLLSEQCTVLLNAVVVTTGNSNSVGKATEDIIKTLSPCFTSLSKWGSFDEFIYSITGRRFSNLGLPESGTVLPAVSLGASWIFVFLFRMYISCRSLYRQAISLMPQDARKAAASMGCLFTVYRGENWIGKTEFMNRNHFSWIVAQSSSLPDVINNVTNLFPSNKIDHAPLIYVLNVLALQRLMDLNRQIKGFHFLYECKVKLAQNHSSNGAADSQKRKLEKWKQIIEVLKLEALDLANFVMDCLPVKKFSCWSKICADNDTWDLCACSLTEKLLPVGIWWLLSQNIDVWGGYASSKILKKVLSLAIYSASRNKMGMRDEAYFSNLVTVNLISSELLLDTVFYEQKNISRFLTSGFLLIFKKLLGPLLSHAGTSVVDLELLPNWAEVENMLKNGQSVCKSSGHDLIVGSRVLLSTTCSIENCSTMETFGLKLVICQNMLNFLCQVIKVHTNAISVSHLTISILNMERFAVFTLMKCSEETLLFNHLELLSLFVSCRRALRYMVLASSAEDFFDKDAPFMQILNENMLSVSWLLKSVSAIVALPCTFFGKESCVQTQEKFSILMDHTSYIFFLVTKGLLFGVMPSVLKAEMHPAEPSCNEVDEKDKNCSTNSDSAVHVYAWKQIEYVAFKFMEEIENLQIILEGYMHDAELEADYIAASWNRISTLVSCFQGFLCGLEVALIMPKKSSMDGLQDSAPFFGSKFHSYINIFEGFVNFCLNLLLANSRSIHEVAFHSYSSALSSIKNTFEKGQTDCSSSSLDLDDHSEKSLCVSYANKSSIKNGKPSVVANTKNHLSVFHLLDLSKLHELNATLLHELLNGENPGIAFLVRQLFISSAAILKLKHILPHSLALSSKIDCTDLEMSSTTVLLKAAFFILLEMSKKSGILESFSYVCLDGILIYLKEISHHVSHSDPVLSKDVYAKLVDIHLRAIGKCISLQGRAATLVSHEVGSSTKLLQSAGESCGSNLPCLGKLEYSLNEFKSKLRLSFRKLTRRPLKLHFVSAVQALERALVGVKQGCSVMYDISTGNLDGGRISAFVAAGVDCFDVVLESALGMKQLGVIKRHIQNLVGALFNIILHLHNPIIFYQTKQLGSISKVNPDPGAVVLMCVEVLTKVMGKNDTFQINSCFINQSLHLPMMLFQDFHQLLVSLVKRHEITVSATTMDKNFSIDLYTACCKLLCTTLGHHKRESGRCIALLEDSVNILLVCLETVNADLPSKESFTWSTPEAVTCATFLRRVYEEMRRHKDLLGRYSSHFLSNYISVSSRLGPLKSGIKREIEEALEPGVYALMDMCQPSDLQEIHTVLDEGPCRKKLADLQHDYKLKFLYEGKI